MTAAAFMAVYAPTARELGQQLPIIGRSLAESLAALGSDPTASRAGLALIQIKGASTYVRKLREALQREACGHEQ